MHMSFSMMLALAVIFGVCALAVVKGGPAERFGGMIVAGATVAVALVHWAAPGPLQTILLLAVDGLVASGFLILALRYASFWLGGAMLLQAVQFSLHAYYLISQEQRNDTYALINNLDSIGVLLCILVGTLIAWRKRAGAAK